MSLKPVDLSKTHVITMVSNPCRYESRYRLFRQWKERMLRDYGITPWVAEVSFGLRDYELTEPHEIRDLQLFTRDELWIKERALQLAVWRMTEEFPDWEYIVWCDSDIEFQNRRWLEETWHQLQHYDVVQCFQTAVDLGPEGQALHTHRGFAYSYLADLPWKAGYVDWHPGFVWAMSRHAYRAVGGFIDVGILGSGDRHMACGWIGQIEASYNGNVSPGYKAHMQEWQNRAERLVRRNMGYVPGTILHHWHGKKKNRGYQDRWKVLVETQFDPSRDLTTDEQGLWRLMDHGDIRSIELRDKIRKYFRDRREDSIDLE